jgi:hypothetical protein
MAGRDWELVEVFLFLSISSLNNIGNDLWKIDKEGEEKGKGEKGGRKEGEGRGREGRGREGNTDKEN